MQPAFFPSRDRLTSDPHKVTNLCYYAPIDAHRRQGWGTDVINGDHPRAYRDNLSYVGQGPTWEARICDLVAWLSARRETGAR